MGNISSKLLTDFDAVYNLTAEELEALSLTYIKERGVEFMDLLLEEGIFSAELGRKERSKRNKVNYWQSEWGGELLNPLIRDLNTREGKRFRRRFRMPATLFFDHLIPMVKEYGIFGSTRSHVVPIEIKCLIALRRLARGETYDTISELTKVSEESCRWIFLHFVHNMHAKLKDTFISFPEIGSKRMYDCMNVYAMLGLPGAVGSMDCTHIKWNKCPFDLQKLCKGAKGYPTIAFQCVCDHAGRIMHVSSGFYGSNNDKFIERLDTLPKRFADGEFQGVKFEMYAENNEIIKVRGIWLIVDGGYLKRAWAIDPMNDRIGFDEVF